MPVHDWSTVYTGAFHDFHHDWISCIKVALNGGLLPEDYYGTAEQVTSTTNPDILTLHRSDRPFDKPPAGAAVLSESPPRVRFRQRAEEELLSRRANRVAVRHASGDRAVAIIEIVSPGNKSSRHGLPTFVEKAAELIRAGVHLPVLDLFPPGPRDPQGIHRLIWDEIVDNDFVPPAELPFTLAADAAGPCPEAFVEPTAVGLTLPEMPVFLDRDTYVPLPLEATYAEAWERTSIHNRRLLLRADAAPPAS